MVLLQKYYKLFCFFIICAVFCSNCGYPYNTPQARAARKQKRLEKKAARQQQKLKQEQAVVNDTQVDTASTTPTLVAADTSQPTSPPTTNPEPPNQNPTPTPKPKSLVDREAARDSSLTRVPASVDSLAAAILATIDADSTLANVSWDSTMVDSLKTALSNNLVDSSLQVALFKQLDSLLLARSLDDLPLAPSLLDSLPTDPAFLDSLLLAGGLDSLPTDPSLLDSLRQQLLDSLDFALVDSTIRPSVIQFSGDSLNVPVQYEAQDSMIYDLAARKIYLYNEAEVFYEQYNLKAGYIEFNFITNVATATCLIDSAGNEVQCPFFDDKNQQFDSRRIEFNFKTKKGKVYDASTQQGDGYLVSNATKFISGDSTDGSNILYSQGCLYTTCDHKHPHFGIRASRAKIIPGKLIVVGPSFLEIMGSPTPILLPFGFFPITKNKRSGLILSMDIDFSPTLGPGIREIGFYLGLTDNIDLKVTGDFYLRGSFRLRAASQYNFRYKGSGSVQIGYNRLTTDEPNTPDYTLQQDFNFSWNHNQASQAHPSQTFSANVQFGTSDYYSNTFNDADNVLQASFTSNVSYTKRFLGTPFSITARLSHTQNTQTRIMTIGFPQINFNMNQIFPFKRPNISGKQRWYERISLSYGMTANNTITTTDTALFQPGGLQEAVQDMNYFIQHSPRLNFSFKVFKYINIQPTVSYSQNWYFYRNRQFLDPTPVLGDTPSDTLQYGTVEEYREYGFFSTHNFSASVRANTQIFATGTFNIGPLRKVRAVISPGVGFTWVPDYSPVTDYYFDSVQTDTRYPDQLRRYNYFSYQPPGQRTARMNYDINMLLDAKVKKGKADSLLKDPYKKIVLLPAATFSGGYNFAADSLHFDVMNFNTYTTLFNKLNLQFRATFDPYTANTENNTRINTFEYEVSGRLVRVTSMGFNASTQFSSNDFKKLFQRKNQPQDQNQDQTDGFDLIRNLSLGYTFSVNQRYINGVDSMVVTSNQITASGSINLSKGWSIRVGNIGYSFKDSRVTFPDFSFARDLHCWQMSLSWQPERQTWNFSIRVKPGSLDFLEVPVDKEIFERF